MSFPDPLIISGSAKIPKQVIDRPIVIRDYDEIELHQVECKYGIYITDPLSDDSSTKLYDCKSVLDENKGGESYHHRPLHIQTAVNVLVDGGEFSSGNNDADTIFIDDERIDKRHHIGPLYPQWGKGKNTKLEDIVYGLPKEYPDPDYNWYSTVSRRNNQAMVLGILKDRGRSENIEICNVKAYGAKRANLFCNHGRDLHIHHNEFGYTQTKEYSFGGEWCMRLNAHDNVIDQVGYSGQGFVTHYYSLDCRFYRNTLKGCSVGIYSQGDLVNSLLIADNNINGSISLGQGQFWGWNGIAWFEDIFLSGNTIDGGWIIIDAGKQFDFGAEVKPKNIFVTDNRVNTYFEGNYPVSIRYVSLENVFDSGNITNKGIQDFGARWGSPSTLLPTVPEVAT